MNAMASPSYNQLAYFADPMCSWCYGFGPVMSSLVAAHPGLTLKLVMGGLRPYTKEPVTAVQKKQIREHWHHVEAASGQPFNDSLLMREGFVYDTEPACRAVATVRSIQNAGVLHFLTALSAAFYRDARDVTKAEILADIAAENGLDRSPFLTALESDQMRDAIKQDFSLTQSLGVQGFPTLCIGYGEQLHMLSNGYASAEVIEERFRQLLSEAAQTTVAGS